MDAKEPVRGESRFEVRERLANVVRAVDEMDPRDVVACLNPVDLIGVQKDDFALDLDADPIIANVGACHAVEQTCELCGEVSLTSAANDSRLCPLQRLAETELIHRLQEIVDRADFERIYGVVVESSYKNHRRHFVGPHCRNDVEAVKLRHLHIEKYQIGLEVADRRDSLRSGLAFAEHDNIRQGGEECAHAAACERLVVDDQHAHRTVSGRRRAGLHAATTGSASAGLDRRRKGITSLTAKPPPSRGPAWNS